MPQVMSDRSHNQLAWTPLLCRKQSRRYRPLLSRPSTIGPHSSTDYASAMSPRCFSQVGHIPPQPSHLTSRSSATRTKLALVVAVVDHHHPPNIRQCYTRSLQTASCPEQEQALARRGGGWQTARSSPQLFCPAGTPPQRRPDPLLVQLHTVRTVPAHHHLADHNLGLQTQSPHRLNAAAKDPTDIDLGASQRQVLHPAMLQSPRPWLDTFDHSKGARSGGPLFLCMAGC